MNHRLENKRVLVSGGSRGIGAAIVERLAREGADVGRHPRQERIELSVEPTEAGQSSGK